MKLMIINYMKLEFKVVEHTCDSSKISYKTSEKRDFEEI